MTPKKCFPRQFIDDPRQQILCSSESRAVKYLQLAQVSPTRKTQVEKVVQWNCLYIFGSLQFMQSAINALM